MELNPTPLEITIFLCLSLSIYVVTRNWKGLRRWWREWRKRHRVVGHLRPRAPEDCPRCAQGIHGLLERPRLGVAPWREKKSKAGRPKQIDSHGYACVNPHCAYYLNADASCHALVSDGKRNGIRYWRCQACGKRRTSRWGTPLYRLKTALARIVMVMVALTEGVDQAAASRIFGHHPSTIARWLYRGGAHGGRLQERLFFRSVADGHVQLDELKTSVKKDGAGVWLWTAITAQSKIVLGIHLGIGGRPIGDACELMHQVWERLTLGCFPVYTSDGLNQYFHGMTAHWGRWEKPKRARKYHWIPDERLQYAQLRKTRYGRKVKFLYSIIRLGTREAIRLGLQGLGLSGRVQTAYVERMNLTLRELIAPLARRTWSMAHDVEHLWLHIQWGLAYYHLVRPHTSLEVHVRGPSKRRHRTPAMAAGLTGRVWSVEELLLLPVPEGMSLEPSPLR